MTCHFGLTEELKATGMRSGDVIASMLSAGKGRADSASPSLPDDTPTELTRQDRDVLLKTILHAADISNPCKPWDLCKLWSDRVLHVRPGV
jgi:hypothetical protein